jgi:hypothetical protein
MLEQHGQDFWLLPDNSTQAWIALSGIAGGIKIAHWKN